MEAWRDKADERLTDVINKELNEVNIITGWTLLVQFVDSDGREAVAFNSMEGQRRTTTLGELLHGLLVEAANVFWDERPDA